jgi:TLC domain
MRGTLKPFYLLQGAYWFQQFLILVLKVEKPRSDWKELIAHHIVTLWLIYGSYVMNMTLYGNAVYITMDLSDAFFSVRFPLRRTTERFVLTKLTRPAIQTFQLPSNGEDKDNSIRMVHLCLDVS